MPSPGRRDVGGWARPRERREPGRSRRRGPRLRGEGWWSLGRSQRRRTPFLSWAERGSRPARRGVWRCREAVARRGGRGLSAGVLLGSVGAGGGAGRVRAVPAGGKPARSGYLVLKPFSPAPRASAVLGDAYVVNPVVAGEGRPALDGAEIALKASAAPLEGLVPGWRYRRGKPYFGAGAGGIDGWGCPRRWWRVLGGRFPEGHARLGVGRVGQRRPLVQVGGAVWAARPRRGLRLRLGTCNGVSNHGGPWQGTFFVLRQREITTVAAITPNASTTGTEIGDSACILQW